MGENFRNVVGVEGSFIRSKIARERCRDLQNVTIYNSDFMRICFKPEYDLVVLVGVLEYSPKIVDIAEPERSALLVLKHAKTALRPDGILVLAIEDRLGIKYWCGYTEDLTGKFFNGIEGSPSKPGIITFSKRELDLKLKLAGFSKLQHYYCFPDYRFATTLFSDVDEGENYYLHNWISTPFSGDLTRKYLFNEALAVKTLSHAGLLREFAKSFLILAGTNSSSIAEPKWVAKHFS